MSGIIDKSNKYILKYIVILFVLPTVVRVRAKEGLRKMQAKGIPKHRNELMRDKFGCLRWLIASALRMAPIT